MRRRVRDDGWRLPDALWAEMLLPPRPRHPLGCHNPRMPDRAAMDAIFFVLCTGYQWNALKETRLCSSPSAHRRFREWAAIDGANRNDHKLMRSTIEAVPVQRPKQTRCRPQHLCLNKGFGYAEPRALAGSSPSPCTCAPAARRPEPNAVPGQGRGAGSSNARTLGSTASAPSSSAWNEKPANYLAMLHLALAAITWRHALAG